MAGLYGESELSNHIYILYHEKYKGLLAVLALAAGSALQAQTNELVIQAGKPGAEIQPTMYGLFSKISTMLPTAVCMPNL